MEVNLPSGEVRVRLEIDSFAADAQRKYSKCFAFISTYNSVLNKAEKCQEWRGWDNVSEGTEKAILETKVSLPAMVGSLQERVRLLHTYQKNAVDCQAKLDDLVIVAEQTDPPDTKAARVAGERIKDLEALLESIKACKEAIGNLQKGEKLSLGKITLLTPAQGGALGKADEQDVVSDFVVVIPEFPNP